MPTPVTGLGTLPGTDLSVLQLPLQSPAVRMFATSGIGLFRGVVGKTHSNRPADAIIEFMKGKSTKQFLMADVAAIKGVTADAVRRAVRRGAVAAHKAGPLWLIRESEVSRYLRTCATKGAVLALTRAMAVDYADHHIRVNALCPGAVHTPFLDRYLATPGLDAAAALKQMKRLQLTGTLARPEDIAAAALYLASDDSSFVTGAPLIIDGGLTGGRRTWPDER